MSSVVVAQMTVACRVGLTVQRYCQTFAISKSRRARDYRRRVVRRLRHNRWCCRRCRINHQFTVGRVTCRITGTVRYRRRHTVALPIDKTAKRAAANRRTARINTPYTARHGNVAVGRSIHHNSQRFPTAHCCFTANNRHRIVRRLRCHYRCCWCCCINDQLAIRAVACRITGTICHLCRHAVPPLGQHIN